LNAVTEFVAAYARKRSVCPLLFVHGHSRSLLERVGVFAGGFRSGRWRGLLDNILSGNNPADGQDTVSVA
ncbi:MAG: hypothetical protein M3021_08065, partial [Actinomycetota bacterium]|nr:hypothetical protein [Actinomycetota bacterium]